MDIRVHPAFVDIAVAYKTIVAEVSPLVRLGIRFEDFEESLRKSADIMAIDRGMPEAAIDMYMRLTRMAFNSLEK